MMSGIRMMSGVLKMPEKPGGRFEVGCREGCTVDRTGLVLAQPPLNTLDTEGVLTLACLARGVLSWSHVLLSWSHV